MKPGEKWSSLIIIHTHKKYRFCWNSPKKKDRLWKLARGNWFQRFFKKHPNQNIPAWHGKHSVPPIWLVAVPFGHFMHIVEEVVLVENTVGFSCSAFRGVCSKMFLCFMRHQPQRCTSCIMPKKRMSCGRKHISWVEIGAHKSRGVTSGQCRKPGVRKKIRKKVTRCCFELILEVWVKLDHLPPVKKIQHVWDHLLCKSDVFGWLDELHELHFSYRWIQLFFIVGKLSANDLLNIARL